MSPYRLYLLRCAVFFTVWGSTLVYSSSINPHYNWYQFPAYDVVLQILPAFWWSVVIMAIGAGFITQLIFSRNAKKRNKQMVMLGALGATVDTIWMIGLTVSLFRGDNSPLGPLLFFACVTSHMIASKMPVQILTTADQLAFLKRESGE